MKLPVAIALLCLLAPLRTASALEVRFLAWDEKVAERDLAVLDGDDAKPVKNLHPLQRTPALSAKPREGSIIVRSLDLKDAEGKPAELPVKIDEAIEHPLVLLLPDAKAPSGLRGFAINDSDSSFPWGTFRVLNATGKALGIGLGTERKALPAGWTPVDLKPAGDKPVPVFFVNPADTKKPLYTGVWKPDPDLRRLVIVVPGTDPRLGPLALKVIPEDRRALAVVP
jgi:hypothetical protein